MNGLIETLDNNKEPILINNILPQSENTNLLKILSNTKGWYIGFEGVYNNQNNFLAAFSNKHPHMGFTLISASEDTTDFNDDSLKLYGRIITNIICDYLKFDYKKILRFYWNYYCKGQEGLGHIDKENNYNISIVYNLMDSDGGTEILEKFYKDVAGQAKVFKSNWWHRGVTTKEDKSRIILNIILE